MGTLDFKKYRLIIHLTNGRALSTVEYGINGANALSTVIRELKKVVERNDFYATKLDGIRINPRHIVMVQRGIDVKE